MRVHQVESRSKDFCAPKEEEKRHKTVQLWTL